ncbi:unnamed protein product [Rhizophagus irregularis]|nr:unnamed protein product [Rhizophagus irregularis]
MTYWQNIEDLLLVNIIKSSQIFGDSDDESNDSEEQLEAEEEEEVVLLGLCSLLDSRYLESHIYNIAKSQICNRQQTSVELQLTIFLRRVSSRDEIFVKWSTSELRRMVHLEFHNIGGFNNVIGAIDGWDYLLGNSAYPLSPFLIKSFINPENNLQIQFNVKHSLHRVVVENAFGRFKNRFSCLKDLNVRKISTAVHFTECCIILYNFLEINNDSWDDLDDDNDDSDSDDGDNNDNEENNNNLIEFFEEGRRIKKKSNNKPITLMLLN